MEIGHYIRKCMRCFTAPTICEKTNYCHECAQAMAKAGLESQITLKPYPLPEMLTYRSRRKSHAP